jgi:hypothetical protein
MNVNKVERALFTGAELPQGFDAALQAMLQVFAQLYEANTTLDGSINDSVTTVVVANGAWMPLQEFPILIGSERMTVRSRSGNTLTVIRGSSPAAHTDGDTVSIPDTSSNAAAEFLFRLRDVNPHFLAAAQQRINTLLVAIESGRPV